MRTGYCATVETKHQKAGRGLISCGPLHINWKGMKCQACFHHSETVKTLPPPPPPPPFPTNWSPLKPSPHITHTPPTPNNHPQPWPNYFPVSQDLPFQTKICSAVLIQRTSTFWRKRQSFFLSTGTLLRWLCVFTCCQTICLSVCLLSLFEQWLVKVPCFARI